VIAELELFGICANVARELGEEVHRSVPLRCVRSSIPTFFRIAIGLQKLFRYGNLPKRQLN
jgi:hypothetical protein